jgi:exopolyphosphatase/guanosine-5'-triphosphate,3'-diphosphate pyrophosphatase
MLRAEEGNFESETALIPKSVKINTDDFENLYQKLIRSTTQEREQMRGLEPMRIEMIVLACLFVKFIIGKLKIINLYQSNFSLKEGVIYQLIKNSGHEQNLSN